MKKTSAILALVLCCMMLFACAAPAAAPAAPAAPAAEAAPATEAAPAAEEAPAPAAEDITLDVIICQYGPNTQEWFLGKGMNGTNFVEKFESENPGVKLNLEVVSWNDVYTVVDTRIANNQAPDILNIDVFANYANEGLLMPVSEYCPDELFADFFPSFIEQSVIDGTVWAVPDLASARALFYNVDMFKEVGIEVPTTWPELKDACQAIIDFYGGDVYPWGIDMTTDEGQAAFAYYTWGNDGGFVDADGKWAVNSAENAEAIQFALDLIKDGYTNPNPATQTRYDLQDMFAAGKLAMVIAPNQLPTYVADKAVTSTWRPRTSPPTKARPLPPSALWTASWRSRTRPRPIRPLATKPSASSSPSSTTPRTMSAGSAWKASCPPSTPPLSPSSPPILPSKHGSTCLVAASSTRPPWMVGIP